MLLLQTLLFLLESSWLRLNVTVPQKTGKM